MSTLYMAIIIITLGLIIISSIACGHFLVTDKYHYLLISISCMILIIIIIINYLSKIMPHDWVIIDRVSLEWLAIALCMAILFSMLSGAFTIYKKWASWFCLILALICCSYIVISIVKLYSFTLS